MIFNHKIYEEIDNSCYTIYGVRVPQIWISAPSVTLKSTMVNE